MSQNLAVLSELTEKLTRDNETLIYNIDSGSAVGGGLYKDACIAIQRAYMPKGSHFDSHAHEGQEWIIISKGRAVFTDSTGDHELSAGGFIHFPAGEKHSLRTLEDTYMYGITVPSEEAYPDA